MRIITLIMILIWASSTNAKAKPRNNVGNSQVYETYQRMKAANKLPPHDIVCIPIKKRFCMLDSCTVIEAKVFNLVSRGNMDTALSRCDSQGCDSYPSQIQQSGRFLNVQTKEPRGLSLKISFIEDNLTYVEITSQLLDTYISYGECRELEMTGK